ncbi:MYOSIN-11 [Salix koriyanagi]|uniref:MYOSIN-11 n=1 Tax=Salix koriyanagi TaxID=2511006 RepID=A0A9Q0UEV5_9ROSI|nr:MYOSIN-11 [Salix koriyanagi]
MLHTVKDVLFSSPFINRKHHCRRCGGLFCGNCTQQRMVLRGQGDSPVRICDPCKKLEEAARFEMRYGHRNRAAKGSSRMTSKNEDEILNKILDNDGDESSSSGQQFNTDLVSSIQRASSSASYSKTQQVTALDGGGDLSRSHSVDEHNHVNSEVGSTTPEELRQQALDEKKRYKILKGEGKSEEALKAFKRGKELERQADALELSIRKNRRKVLSSANTVEIQNEDGIKESVRKSKRLAQVNEKDDLTAELRGLGWSDMDLHEKEKKSVKMSLEGELSSLLGEISGKTNKDMGNSGIDKTQVAELKRKALALKREGKLGEAKEELKKAKVLEKKLEEQELLGVDEESDDEISALIRSMDNDPEDNLLAEGVPDYGFNLDHLVGTSDDLGVDSNFEVTDEDLVDPELAATLKSLGWADEPGSSETTATHSVPIDRETLQSEILLLKREALNHKRAGNVTEAMAHLKKAKLLERDLESLGGDASSLIAHDPSIMRKGSPSENTKEKNNVSSKPAPKSRLTIQKELLALKKKALALRREGRLDEAEEELKKGKVLEQQLEEMDNVSIVKEKQVLGGIRNPGLEYEHPAISGGPPIREEEEEDEEDVTDQDMHDPAYLSLLSNLGWKDDDDEHPNSSFNPPKENDNTNLLFTHSTSNISMKIPRRSKAEIQRELIGLKRKALTLRREGKTNEAEEVLTAAKSLEAEMEEMETPKKEIQTKPSRPKDKIIRPVRSAAEEGDMDDITEKDMQDPSLISMLTSLGWKDDEDEARELLGLKRKALALRRKGETEEAEELSKMAKVLESQMEEVEGPKELPINNSEDKKSQSSGSLTNHEKQNNVKIAMGTTEKFISAAVDPDEKVLESFVHSGSKESDTIAPLLRSPDIVNSVSFELNKGKHPSVGELDLMGEIRSVRNSGINHGNYFIPPPHQSVNVMDLLTGDDWSSPQIPAGKLEDKVNFGSDTSSLPEHHVHVGSLRSHPVRNKNEEISSVSDVSLSSDPHGHVHAPKNLGSKENARTKLSEETVNADKKPHVDETDSVQALVSQNNKSSLQQEILAHKRKALALKREGKLAEAREELRQAKLLEKSLEVETPEPAGGTHDGSTSASNASSAQQKDHSAPKPLSGRDRFKLQQESLGHKRQALKMRREGRVEEAEAEFELAKALEARLDEMSSANVAEPVDDVVVEDLLDPQLLSALKAIGIQDTSIISQGSERPGPVKVSPTQNESNSQERIQLEERIKAEKLKAVNLKRAGKQAEALDALRRSKMFEKKLNSLA